MSLIRAEWRRLFARRITVVMLALTILVLALAGLAVAAHSHPHTPETLARAEAFIESQRAQNLDLCLADARAGRPGPEGQPAPTEDQCQRMAEQFQPSVEEFQGYQFTFRRDMSTLLVFLGGLLCLFAFVVGASSIGAEWTSGGMATALMWRPQRGRLLVGKLIALLAGVLTIGAVVSLGWTAAMWFVGKSRGDAGTTRGGLASLGLRDIRALALVAACAVAGFAIASLGRHTAAALGTAIGYVAVFEVALRIVLSVAHAARPERYFLTNYMLAWVNNSNTYLDSGGCSDLRFDAACVPSRWVLGAGPSAGLIAAIMAATLMASFAALRRRDVP